jgi:hypothetical protein
MAAEAARKGCRVKKIGASLRWRAESEKDKISSVPLNLLSIKDTWSPRLLSSSTWCQNYTCQGLQGRLLPLSCHSRAAAGKLRCSRFRAERSLHTTIAVGRACLLLAISTAGEVKQPCWLTTRANHVGVQSRVALLEMRVAHLTFSRSLTFCKIFRGWSWRRQAIHLQVSLAPHV